MEIEIRNADPEEWKRLGQIMVDVYSSLDGFPRQNEQPAYYQMLENIGTLTKNPNTEIIVAVDSQKQVLGGVVYFSDMKYYGSGGTATAELNSAGFRLLAVDKAFRGNKIGKRLTQKCIEKAQQDHVEQLIIHSTKAMQTAWGMYERMGFARSKDLDFMQGQLPVFGFRMRFQK
ncbi:GNAT family N-acetyltransferase [Salinimicrobium oceani]|uniref:GNAT family N-acetyltransferase n=1 Tax=Salinimicrobium oceani TaxID=2722702 RepID=A0ABX1D0Z4_9FLAO|nr:GNAT family N-acetyltransferase [Salinimicrobium oceani]NJW52343.1 GNAT family N-acetyltransferase [Salinimicrobium oceani]